MRSKKSGGILIAVLGLTALILGIVFLVQQNTFTETKATVVGMRTEWSSGEDHNLEYIYTVKYEVDGVEYQGEITEGSEKYASNQIIDIKYNPEKPSTITQSGKGISIYCLILGPVLILLGGFVFIRNK